LIGQTISHYKILEEIGRGGMGVVFKADDLKLKRPVALKFLAPHLLADPDQSQRFIHEAQAAAALDHPNIATVHEVHESDGQTFIVMAYIEGKDLGKMIDSGPLPIADSLDIAIQIAGGLAKAHGAGIVHRDVKPANVILTPEGLAKVLDFGLAKLATQTRLTRTGTTMGTARYMSPEQATCEAVDHRSDIWSLGVILYEMLTGQSPFRGEIEPARVYSILNEDPKPVSELRKDVPLALEDIVEKTLAKDPEKRYASMDEFLAALEPLRDQITLMGIKAPGFHLMRKLKRRKRRLAGVTAVLVIAVAAILLQTFFSRGPGIDSVAVLPFTNLSGDPEQEYFCDGMTETLINELGKISALTVISLTSVMRFKDTKMTLQEITRALDVDAVVEASVLRSGHQVTITAQLIRADPERQIWADSFERDTRDVLKVHGLMARAIVERIEVAMSSQEKDRIERDTEVDPAAHDAYLKGLYYYNKLSVEGYWTAVRNFRKAIDIDPTYALPYAGLANAYNMLNLFGDMTIQESAPLAKAAALHALELDESLGWAHTALGWIKWTYEWDWPGAEAEFRFGIDLSPNTPDAHMNYDTYLVCMGRFEEAIAHSKRAVELDPLTRGTTMHLAWVYQYAGRGDEVIRLCRQQLKEGPSVPAFHWLAYGYLLEGKHTEAIAALDSAFALSTDPDDLNLASQGGFIYGRAGATDKAQALLDNLLARSRREYIGPITSAFVQSGLGNTDEMFALLEKAYEARSDGMVWIQADYGEYRDDPRYLDLARRINFPMEHSK